MVISFYNITLFSKGDENEENHQLRYIVVMYHQILRKDI